MVQAQSSDSTPNQDDDPDIQGAPADGEVAAEIVNRPEGDNVVSITPNGDRITIKDSNNGETQSDAPLWQDNPNKDEPGADPGSQNIGDTTGDEDVMVVLNRPTTTTDDGEEHTKQWDAWYATYYELVALGNDFIECETGDHVPGGEECWVVDVSLVSETLEEEEEADSDDGGQGSTPSALPLTPEQRWPGRNYQWTDPGPVDEPDTDQTPPVDEPGTDQTPPVDEPGTDQTPPVDEPDTDQTPPVDEPDTDQTPPVDEPGSGEDANPLTTIGQNPEDGSEITIVNIPSSTNDPEQRKRNFDLENEALDALDEAGEPYVVCFGDETYTDMHTGDTVTIPAFCNVIDPSV